jgi:hypothetical protein
MDWGEDNTFYSSGNNYFYDPVRDSYYPTNNSSGNPQGGNPQGGNPPANNSNRSHTTMLADYFKENNHKRLATLGIRSTNFDKLDEPLKLYSKIIHCVRQEHSF